MNIFKLNLTDIQEKNVGNNENIHIIMLKYKKMSKRLTM